MKTISATEAARNFSEVLDTIARTGETFRIERHGQAVAHVGPVAPGKRLTGRELVGLLNRLPAPDDAFASDLARIRAEWGAAPLRDPWQTWGLSSTAQS